jgi:hypothetical protein
MNISISKFLNLARWLTRPKAQVPGFDQVIGSPESILIFLKNQNDVVLVKKKNKSQRVATEFLTRSCRVSWVMLGFDFLYFF